MLFAVSLIPATILVVIGYFVLFSAMRAEGGVKRFGQYLAAWVIFLGGVSVAAGLLASTLGVQLSMGGIGQHRQAMEQMEEEQTKILRDLQHD